VISLRNNSLQKIDERVLHLVLRLTKKLAGDRSLSDVRWVGSLGFVLCLLP
jgi:hypothetical protein